MPLTNGPSPAGMSPNNSQLAEFLLGGDLHPLQVAIVMNSEDGRSHQHVASTTSSVQLIGSGPRNLACIFNESTANLYIAFGFEVSDAVPNAGVLHTKFSHKILPGGYFEVPQTMFWNVQGAWDAVNGFAHITLI